MRTVIVLTFVTLDRVMQAPGGPQEDTDGSFAHGGWVMPHFDERLGAIMHEQMTQPRDLLLGRKTYEIFASYWPAYENEWPGIHSAFKYVVSSTRADSLWENTVFLKGNVVEEIRRLKQQEGPDLQVHGSSQLVQALLKHDLVDELWLKIFPLVLSSARASVSSAKVPFRRRSRSRTRRPRPVVSSSPVMSVPET